MNITAAQPRASRCGPRTTNAGAKTPTPNLFDHPSSTAQHSQRRLAHATTTAHSSPNNIPLQHDIFSESAKSVTVIEWYSSTVALMPKLQYEQNAANRKTQTLCCTQHTRGPNKMVGRYGAQSNNFQRRGANSQRSSNRVPLFEQSPSSQSQKKPESKS